MNSVIIGGIKVDTEIFSFRFECDYAQCKGYCCWGDSNYSEILGGCFLSERERSLINKNKMLFARYVDEDLLTFLKKPLAIYKDGMVLVRSNDEGCVLCSKKRGSCVINLARKEGRIAFGLPLWGALEPLMLVNNKHLVIDWSVFDDFDPCKKSMEKSQKSGKYIWQFLKSQLIDYFGEDFYNQLVEEAEKWI